MKKNFLLLTAAVLCVLVAQAVPAQPGLNAVTQADGSTIMLQTVGDEWHSALLTSDGLAVARGADGNFYYLLSSQLTTMRAHDPMQRSAQEASWVQPRRSQLSPQMPVQAVQRRANSSVPKLLASQVPHVGAPRVPILLVEFSDKAMSNSLVDFEAHFNQGSVSAGRYFADQSNGKYTPQYDVMGIYTLSGTRATYGAHATDGTGRNDVGLCAMVGEAIDKAAAAGVDFSPYDNNGDGEVDVVIVMYAGVGEAQASTTVPESIWPCQWSLSYGQYYNDGTGSRTVNGVTCDKFAVFNEVHGSNDNGTQLDGIGTFCHEFSHCLGLPDFYDTKYGGHFGMGYWSLMHYGCYNDNTYTPCGYSAYEKNYMGWVDLINPVENTYYTLPAFNQANAATDKAVRIMSDVNSAEWFVLENRRKQGWDTYIPGEGLLVTHFSYMKSSWDNNSPNNGDIQLATFLPADNTYNYYDHNGDCWPNGANNALTDNSSPATVLHLNASGDTLSNAGYLGKPVTQITQNGDGTVSFWYVRNNSQLEVYTPVMQPADTNDVTLTSFKAEWTDATPAANVDSYTLLVNNDPYAPVTPATHQLGSLDFSACEYGSWVNLPSPWAASYLLGGGNCAYLVNRGEITFIVPNGYDHAYMTVQVTTGTNYGDGTLSVSSPATAAVTRNVGAGSTNRWLVVASTGDLISISTPSSDYGPEMVSAEVWAGNLNASAAMTSATETGDANSRIVTGITGRNYTVASLASGDTFYYKVKALYTDGTESAWSNMQTVTLREYATAGNPDINDDGAWSMADVTTLIAYVLGENPSPCLVQNCDLTGDGNVTMADVTTLINQILGL